MYPRVRLYKVNLKKKHSDLRNRLNLTRRILKQIAEQGFDVVPELVRTIINASIWYGDVIGRNIEVQTANLSPQPASIAPDHSLWQTAELLVADLK